METTCPRTHARGQPVKSVTVSSLVRPERASTVAHHQWSYCADPECDVVYFADDGTTLLKSDLTVRVGDKEAESPRLVCYCFGHTRESIGDEVKRTGASTVVESVTEKVAAGECACATKNPKGSCCIADLRRVVEEAAR